MSSNANPAKSRLWLDGDGFRAAVGTALPTNITSIFTSTITGWDPFGGIKAGFTVSGERETTDITIWNLDGAYRTKKNPPIDTIRFRVVDESKATVQTILQGGSLVEVGVAPDVAYRWIKGEDEEFATLLNGLDPMGGAIAFHFKRVTLVNVPEEAINDEDLYGHDFELKVLSDPDGGQPYDKYTLTNALAVTP